MPTPSLEVDRIPFASSRERTDPYKLHSLIMAWPREIWRYPKSFSLQTHICYTRGREEGKRTIRNGFPEFDLSNCVNVMLLIKIKSKNKTTKKHLGKKVWIKEHLGLSFGLKFESPSGYLHGDANIAAEYELKFQGVARLEMYIWGIDTVLSPRN